MCEAAVVRDVEAGKEEKAGGLPKSRGSFAYGGADGGAQWHEMPHDLVVSFLGSDSEQGLTKEEAAKRLVENGPNLLTAPPKPTLLQRIWKQVNNVLVMILAVVAVVSVIQGVTSDGQKAVTAWIQVALIVMVVSLNTWIGLKQEGNAEKSAEALKAMLSSDAVVIRSGEKMAIPAEELVDGDVVVLAAGDSVPADIRLISCTNLSITEAALTGESMPVDKKPAAMGPGAMVYQGSPATAAPTSDNSTPSTSKNPSMDKSSPGMSKDPSMVSLGEANNTADVKGAEEEASPPGKMAMAMPQVVPLGDRKNMAFSATLVSSGEGLGVVVATGDDTEIGAINRLVSTAEERETQALIQIDLICKYIAGFVTASAIVTFLVGYLYAPGEKNSTKVVDAINTALIAAVAMVPEGLEAIVTITFAYAVSKMARLNAIVRKLPSVETLGSVTVICSDSDPLLSTSCRLGFLRIAHVALRASQRLVASSVACHVLDLGTPVGSQPPQLRPEGGDSVGRGGSRVLSGDLRSLHGAQQCGGRRRRSRDELCDVTVLRLLQSRCCPVLS
jgi:magnesium-transporting ATPase (P-type)